MKKWSRKYYKCTKCKTNDVPHRGRGLCLLCYDKKRKKNTKSRATQARYRENHRDEIRERNRVYHLKNRERMFVLLGGKCCSCGFSDRRALQIDHVNGGGIKERANINTKDFHRHVIKEVKKGSKEYQLLCANCNWIKRHKKQEWGGGRCK